METGDEPSRHHGGPSTPDERSWRHPSEVHAPDRDRIPAVASPPPVRRRTAATIALLAVTSSVVLLIVALPGAVPAGTPEPEAEGSPTTLPVKGAGGKLRGVEVTSGMFAVPTAEVGAGATDRTVRSPDGTDHGSERIAEVPGLGVTILSSSGKPTRCTYMLLYDENEFRYLLRAGSLKVRDRSGAVLTVNGSIVIDPQDNGLIPLDVNGELDAVGVLLGPDDQTLGVVAEIRHSTVALLLPAVEKVICDA